jgi:hypothetical protein
MVDGLILVQLRVPAPEAVKYPNENGPAMSRAFSYARGNVPRIVTVLGADPVAVLAAASHTPSSFLVPYQGERRMKR